MNKGESYCGSTSLVLSVHLREIIKNKDYT